jgi:hypothetical protein
MDNKIRTSYERGIAVFLCIETVGGSIPGRGLTRVDVVERKQEKVGLRPKL